MFACSYREFPTLAEMVDRADAIFVGRITRVSVAEPGSAEVEAISEARVDVSETFKGEAASQAGLQPKFGPGNCTNPLFVGPSCVFFVTQQQGRPFLEHLGFGCAPKAKLE